MAGFGSIIGGGIGFLIGGPAGAMVGASIGGGVESIQETKKATRAQRASNDMQQRIADVKAQRERTRLIAETRRKRATLANQAELSGVGGSTGAIAGQSGLQSQAASGLSFLDQVQSLGQQSNIFLNQAAGAQSRAATSSAIAGVAGQFATATGAYKKLFE